MRKPVLHLRGSPFSPVVWFQADILIGHPVSLARRENLNKKSWGFTGPNTWLVEP
jgi:hypothetical protein